VTNAILTLAGLLPLVASAASVSIQLEGGAFEARGVTMAEPSQGWASAFSVYAGSGDVPQMTGTYSRTGNTLKFQPRYPLASGMEYRAVFHALGDEAVEARFDGPKAVVGPVAHLEKMYPSIGVLPANQLKLYLQFSQPMARGGIWSHIRLIRDDGFVVELPFLEIDQELWSPDQRRLTVLFDPGRIKRGVTPQQEMGEALEAGRSYTLVVDRELRDANNQPLAEEFRHQFHISPSLREGIDPKKWTIANPSAGSTTPLSIAFDRPLDWALLQHTFQVKAPGGEIVSGTADIDRDETRWRFTPAQPWKTGRYELIVDMALEDLAGNRIGRPFDVDLFERVTERITQQTTTLAFELR